MNRSDPDPTELVTYALRLREHALRDINTAYVRFAEEVSEAIANEWRDGLMKAIGELATLPRRCSLALERFRREVRQLLYQRPGSQVKYRILFTITGTQEALPEPPTVTVIHVRHASTRPITRTQVREIEAEE
jgi:plasmid stabilization system protein ParE